MIYLSKKNKEKGFTLIEILISVSILAIIILGINKIYFSILENQRSITAQNFVHSDVEYFLRLASNNIRLAQKSDGTMCAVPADKFFLLSGDDNIFFSKNDVCWGFYLSTNDEGNGEIRFYNSDPILTDEALTSSNVNILDLSFAIEDNISTGQPIVTILVKAAPKNDPDNYIYAQTSVSINY
ncbi:MAG TPA: prepilin-type N-terminal cleavage/methylation domain-containing protein [bacterium]|nr:prepilin-type N-terminal cleavage/methylation domain-containing protein [bacterium]